MAKRKSLRNWPEWWEWELKFSLHIELRMQIRDFMEDRYLEVTFRKGKPFAAYFHLPRIPGEKSIGTQKAGSGILIDYCKSGRPIGIEIVDPAKINLQTINDILSQLNLNLAEQKDLAPLLTS